MSSGDHQRKFKNAGKSDDLRRRRAEGSVELRKTRKEDHLMKRRNIDAAEPDLDDGEVVSSPEIQSKVTKATRANLTLDECMQVFKNDQSRLDVAVESVRRWLSKQSNPAVGDVLKIGALPYLIKALDHSSSKVQFEAAWALTNISSGTSEQTRQVVEGGALPRLVQMLDSDDLMVAEQACWALGNVAGDSAGLRDAVYQHNILQPMLRLCHKPLSTEFVRTLVWTISNLCRHKNPAPPLAAVEFLLPIIKELLNYNDTAAVVDACWALAYISDSSDDRIELIIGQGLVPKLVTMMSTQEPSIIAPSLRCLGNIVTGTDVQTQVVVDSGVLSGVLPALVHSGKNIIVKEAMWLLSNIAAGNQGQIQAVLDADLLVIVLGVLLKGDYKSQFEAMWVVTNMASGGNDQQVKTLLEQQEKMFQAVCGCLKAKEPRMIGLALDCLNYLLQASSKFGRLEKAAICVEENQGLDTIEELQSHPSEQIYNKALHILENYFCNDDEENVENNENQPPQLNKEGLNDFSAPQMPDGGFSF